MYAYIQHMHKYLFGYIHTCTCAFMCVCVCVCVRACAYVCARISSQDRNNCKIRGGMTEALAALPFLVARRDHGF